MRQSTNFSEKSENIKVRSTRNTWQKKAVYGVFCSMKNHPTAEMVCDKVAIEFPSIGRATVYRILNSFVDTGKAIKVPVCDGADRFDITTFPHSHAKCRVCGNVFDINVKTVMPETDDPCGFKVESVAVLYLGVCHNCQIENSEK